MTLTLYRNGTPVLTTSTSDHVITGGKPGLGVWAQSGNNMTLDDWEGGNVPTTRLVVTGGGTQTAGGGTQTAGGSQGLTITAKDASGNPDTTYTGSKTLIFSGAGSSANPVTAPTVADSTGAAQRRVGATGEEVEGV